MLLSAHLGLYRAETNDYPWREVVRSVLPVADEVLLACPSRDEDGTREAADALAREYPAQVRVFYTDWWRPTRGSQSLADVTNYLITRCRSTYHLAIQADEVLHEAQQEALLAVCREGRALWAELGRLNFFGTFDAYNGRLDRWPCSVVRLARREFYPIIRSYDDATHLGILDTDPTPYPRLDLRSEIQLWHYSYVRWPRAYVQRQKGMADLYGLEEDPRIVRWRERGRIDWWEMASREELVPLPGPHPAVMTDWIAARRAAVESGVIA